MSVDEAVARAQVEANDPEVKSGQLWDLLDNWDGNIPREIRVVCRYPFAKSHEGRVWVVERAAPVGDLQRVPEFTLRQLYEMREDVE